MHRKSNNHKKSKNVSRKKSRHTKKTHVKYGGALIPQFQKILKKEKIKPSISASKYVENYRQKLFGNQTKQKKLAFVNQQKSRLASYKKNGSNFVPVRIAADKKTRLQRFLGLKPSERIAFMHKNEMYDYAPPTTIPPPKPRAAASMVAPAAMVAPASAATNVAVDASGAAVAAEPQYAAVQKTRRPDQEPVPPPLPMRIGDTPVEVPKVNFGNAVNSYAELDEGPTKVNFGNAVNSYAELDEGPTKVNFESAENKGKPVVDASNIQPTFGTLGKPPIPLRPASFKKPQPPPTKPKPKNTETEPKPSELQRQLIEAQRKLIKTINNPQGSNSQVNNSQVSNSQSKKFKRQGATKRDPPPPPKPQTEPTTAPTYSSLEKQLQNKLAEREKDKLKRRYTVSRPRENKTVVLPVTMKNNRKESSTSTGTTALDAMSKNFNIFAAKLPQQNSSANLNKNEPWI
jgi:hypothetical protein